jgi:hypothetical protein
VAEIAYTSSGILEAEWRVARVEGGGNFERSLGIVRQQLSSAGRGQVRLVSPKLPDEMAGLYEVRLVVRRPVLNFDLPRLRYYISPEEGGRTLDEISLIGPDEGTRVTPATIFAWEPAAGAEAYQVEIFPIAPDGASAGTRAPASAELLLGAFDLDTPLVAGKLVPFMAVVYIGAALIIIALNITALPDAVMTIFKSAFGLDALGGGLVGALINGMRRATYSCEAGVGSAAIAHASVRTNEPMTEGYVALIEPFLDTIVVCTITALVVIVTGVYEPFLFTDNVQGIEITSQAFENTFSWFPVILLVSSTLFAFTSLVSWAFYGAQAFAYLSGGSKYGDIIFKVLLCVALSTGAAVSVGAILNFIDSMLFAMAIPNILALYFLLPELKRDVKAYETKHGI